MQDTIILQAKQAAAALCDATKLQKGDLMVVGCSSSEVIGQKIGTDSNVEVARQIFEAIWEVLKERGIYLATQCCEHLNRALIVEREAAEKFALEQVNVVPQPKAGGSFSTAAYQAFAEPVAVESVQQKAKAGMDIGGTLIGMHVKPVVVPVRLEIDHIGEAILLCARYRPKFVGGSRAHYDESLL